MGILDKIAEALAAIFPKSAESNLKPELIPVEKSKKHKGQKR